MAFEIAIDFPQNKGERCSFAAARWVVCCSIHVLRERVCVRVVVLLE